RSVLEAMLDAVVGDAPSPMLFAEIRHAGGAVQTANPNVSFDARAGEWLLELVGMIAAPGADVELDGRFAAAWRRLDPVLAALSGYLNFAEGFERIQVARQAFST